MENRICYTISFEFDNESISTQKAHWFETDHSLQNQCFPRSHIVCRSCLLESIGRGHSLFGGRLFISDYEVGIDSGLQSYHTCRTQLRVFHIVYGERDLTYFLVLLQCELLVNLLSHLNNLDVQERKLFETRLFSMRFRFKYCHSLLVIRP